VVDERNIQINPRYSFMDQYLGHRIIINLTEDLWDKMKAHQEIRWPAVGRELLTKYLQDLESNKTSSE
jgi:hypothetical protein